MKRNKIQLLALLTASFFASSSFAEETIFQGWSVALGTSIVDGNLEVPAVNQSQTVNFGRTKIIGTLDATYSIALDEKWGLGFGGSIDLNEARILDVVLLNGKLKNHTLLYIQPTYSLTPSTAAFAKIGYSSAKLVLDGGIFNQSTGSSESVNGTALGLGVKSFFDKNVFAQFEFINTNYRSKSMPLLGDGNSVKPSTTSVNISLGYNF